VEPCFVSGHDFSRAVEALLEFRALAPAISFSTVCSFAAAKAVINEIALRQNRDAPEANLLVRRGKRSLMGLCQQALAPVKLFQFRTFQPVPLPFSI
jgi:hypothetical protein